MAQNIKIVIALFVAWGLPVTAAEMYRWTDPETGVVMMTPTRPSYPIKQQRSAGVLPTGEIIELTIDADDPKVKALVQRQKGQETKQKRTQTQEKTRSTTREVDPATWLPDAELQEKQQRSMRAAENMVNRTPEYQDGYVDKTLKERKVKGVCSESHGWVTCRRTIVWE